MCLNKNVGGLPVAMEHSQVSVCVFQYSPNRSATPLRVWMAATAMSGMEATPVNANTDTGGSTVRKVSTIDTKLKEYLHVNLCSVIIKTSLGLVGYYSNPTTALMWHEGCH